MGWNRHTGNTSNLSAGLNSHFKPLFHLPLAEPTAWGSAVPQQTVVAFENCVPSPIWVKGKNYLCFICLWRILYEKAKHKELVCTNPAVSPKATAVI